MKAKKIITIMMALTLALGVVGCGKDEESKTTSQSTQEESNDSKNDSEIIEQNEKNLFELGAKQTKEIKTIIEKYGIKTSYGVDKNTRVPIVFSKDENDCGAKGAKGYTVTSVEDMKLNDGGDNNYNITYGSYIRENKDPYYAYDISIVFPDAREFKLDEFKMFKELVKSVFGDDYDTASLESWIQEHIRKIEAGEKKISSGRDTGSYREGLMGGEKSSGSGSTRLLTYRLTLRK